MSFFALILFTLISFNSTAQASNSDTSDQRQKDTSNLQFPISQDGTGGGLDLPNPENVQEEVTYNPKTGKYEIRKKIGDRYLPGVRELTREEYMKEYSQKINRDYFRNQGRSQNFARGGSSNSPTLGLLPSLDKFMGNGLIEIQPTGTAELILGMNINRVKNPNFSIRQQKPPPQLVFDQNIQLGVNGNIGDRIRIGIRYDTKAMFDFENQTKLDWVGKEDDILKKIEVGNISMPLNSSLIQGGSNLFGFRTEMQFGRLTWSALFSQNKGQRTEQTVSGGAQITEFDIQGDMYDVNRHFFLSQYFYENYDNSLSNLPIINTAVVINRIEVWVTNRSGMFENTRDVVAFMDISESRPFNQNVSTGSTIPYPSNEFNSLYSQVASNPQARNASTSIDGITTALPSFEPGFDYEYLNGARKLNDNEYQFNNRLGYISLNQALNNDEVLAVAFEYTYNGQVYKVGEFAAEVAQAIDSRVLFVKMLKSTTVRTKIPMWKLMMKNIYSLNTFNLNLEDFYLDVIYADDPSGADLNYLPVENVPGLSGGVPLLRVFNLDRINRQQEAKPDGVFDAIEGITVNKQKGQIIFPVAEPFGRFLKNKFGPDSAVGARYVFDALYDSTRWMATQDVYKNKFFLRGQYKGSSSAEIMLNSVNVPPGSVQVFANGNKLRENQDYIVDYNSGKVTIVNQGILSSGANITVSSENQTMFNTQQKTMMGSRFDYVVNDKLNLGGTFMHMYERPLTPKTNIGEDPLMNTIFGVDGIYNSKSRFLTRLVDKIPFIETKEESSLLVQAEYAQIIPGRARSIEKGGERGISYIDDFEAAETPFELRQPQNWKLASVPQKQLDLFPEVDMSLTDKTSWLGKKALLAWYTIDPTFFRNDRTTPQNIKDDVEMQSNHYMREISVREVFKGKELQQGVPNILPTLDLAFFPKERGPYNYNANANDFDASGKFVDPSSTWGGIMRRIETNDFEAANIDYLEIWMMDPYFYNLPGTEPQGQLYINLGNISEDILPDRRKSYENGLPRDANNPDIVDVSFFGYVPLLPQVNFAFANEPGSRPFQDVGLDGMNDQQEREFHRAKFLDSLLNNFGANSQIYQAALADPSNDNYRHSRDPFYDNSIANIIERYKKFNGHQGNSTLELLPDGSPMSSTTFPDVEDINNDFTMSQNEDYFQYKIELSSQSLRIGQNFVTDSISSKVLLKNGKEEDIVWYQFKIPIREYEKVVGNISDFKSIRFMRIFMKGFEDSVVLRFAQMQLVRSDWRRHLTSLKNPGVQVPVDPTNRTIFSISTVNIEENGTKQPFPYVTPPNVVRELDPITPGAVQRNEQSIALNYCNLEPDDARGAFKTMNLDIRNYKNLKMFIHAEGPDLQDDEMYAFIRLGTDVLGNYYEYEIPLKTSEPFNNQPNNIWRVENNMDFELEEFYKTKQERSNVDAPMSRPFVRILPDGRRITLIGLPDLSNVRVIMLGVRNRSNRDQCGEVWFNELRVTDISNRGGWAATGRMVAQLADFSTVNFAGSIRTIGFGGIDQRLNERSLNDHYQYDINTNIELGKFFPQRSGITIPMFIGYNENIIRPKFNPLNPDIELRTTLSTISDQGERERVKKAAEDYTSRYSLNFVNVRKNRMDNKKQKPWDIENFNLSYSIQKQYRRNQQIEEQIQNTYRGSLGYMFSLTPKPWEPLKKLIKSNKVPIVKDFNLYLYPQTVTMRLDVDRYYSEQQNRSNDLFRNPTPRLFDKNFTMNRFYQVGWTLSKNLKFDYQSNANARIEEPVGRLDEQAKRDSVRREFFGMGQMARFNQTANLNYTVPINKIKALNWIQVTTRFSANFEWDQPPPAAPSLGSTIQNSRTSNLNATFNLISFYNKFKIFRNLNAPARGGRPAPSKPGQPGQKEEDKKKPMSNSTKNVLRFITMFKQASFNYQQTSGMALPGFMHTPEYLGNNFGANAPGWDFILGGQDPSIRYRLAQQGAITLDPQQASFFTQQVSNTYQGKITVEPIKDMRIDLDFMLNESQNTMSNFRFDADSTETIRDIGLRQTGMFNRSGIFIRTAFDKVDEKQSTETFEQLLNNRYTIAQRLQGEDGRVQNGLIDTSTSFPVGYSQINQDVLINSFYAAYTGKNNASVGLNIFQKMPLPNWRINYNGLSKIEAFKKYFTNISLTHNYTGMYSIANYTSELRYSENAAPQFGVDFVPEYQVGSVSITENFAPLAGVNVTMKNNWNVRFEYRKTRMVNLLVANQQLTENRRDEVSVGVGYRAKEILLPIKWRGRRILLENDLNFMMDIAVMDNVMIRRDLNTPLAEPTQGSRTVSIRPTVDYMVNNHINISLFLDHRSNAPKTSQAFPTSLTEFGIKMRYNL